MKHLKSVSRMKPPARALALLEKQALLQSAEQTVSQVGALVGVIVSLKRPGDGS